MISIVRRNEGKYSFWVGIVYFVRVGLLSDDCCRVYVIGFWYGSIRSNVL